jgi:hypothetical protein
MKQEQFLEKKCWFIGSCWESEFSRDQDGKCVHHNIQDTASWPARVGPLVDGTRSNALGLVPHFLLVAHVKFVSWVIILLFLS